MEYNLLIFVPKDSTGNRIQIYRFIDNNRTNSQITELVFRDSSKSEIKTYTDLKGKLITELNLAIDNAHNQLRRSA